MSNGTYIVYLAHRFKVNLENPVFFTPDVEMSATLGIYPLLKDVGPAPEISRKGGSCMDAVAGTHTSHAHGGKRLSRGGLKNQEDGSERKKQDSVSV